MDGAPKIAVLADEDIEEDPDRWCSYTACGQELWQIASQWVWNLRLSLGQAMQGVQVRAIEWAPPKEAPPVFIAEEPPPEAYGPWQWAAAFGRATGLICAEDFVLQEDGKLRCPAGASLWLSEVRQENEFTEAGRVPRLPDRLSALCSAGAVPGKRRQKAIGRVASALSAVFCLRLPRFRTSPSCLDRCGGSMWPDEHFAAPGRPTGVGNTLRSFPWFRPSRRLGLLLVHLVPCVHITAGVGRIDSPAMPGSDHRTCVSRSLVFLVFWRGTNRGGTGRHRSYFNTVLSPSECIRRARNPCRLAALSLSSPKAFCRCAEVPLRIKA